MKTYENKKIGENGVLVPVKYRRDYASESDVLFYASGLVMVLGILFVVVYITNIHHKEVMAEIEVKKMQAVCK